MMPEQSTYRVPPSAYIKEYLFKYGRLPALVVLALLSVAFIAGFSDMRWWLIGLMGLFVVVPMMITMGCFIAVGRKDMALRLHPQSVSQTADGIELSFYKFDSDEENPEPIQSVMLSGDKISRVTYGSKYIKVNLRQSDPFDFILIPTEYLPHSTIFEDYKYE